MENLKKFEKIIGIDEAGKGPVLGSLYIGVSIIKVDENYCEKDFENYLNEIGVDDSKKIKQNKRVEILKKIKSKENVKVDFVEITPKQIDGSDNLNELEINNIVSIIEKQKADKIYIDALTANPEKFKEKILTKLSYIPKLICENKADEKYKIVGLASLSAKVERESHMENLKKKFNIELGSGYPGDMKTKNFLKENYKNEKYEKIIRKSWKTYKNLVSKNLLDF